MYSFCLLSRAWGYDSWVIFIPLETAGLASSEHHCTDFLFNVWGAHIPIDISSSSYFLKKKINKVVQWIKLLTAKSEDLGSIPRPTIERKDRLLWCTCVCTQIHTQIKIINK